MLDPFYQHDDNDVVIPDRISFKLVLSAHLLLANAVYASILHFWGLFIVLVCVYITSILYWYRPRFSAYARKADFAAVAATIFYGAYFVSRLSRLYWITFIVGLCIIGIIFITNELLYYIQVMKSPLGNDLDDKEEQDQCSTNILMEEGIELQITNNDEENKCLSVKKTLPFTAERNWVYNRTVIVHMICVHIFANILILILLIGGKRELH